MKYRLKHDHSKTLEAVPTPKHIPPWVRVDFYDAQYHCFSFDVPAAFLEVSGWEPVPEKEPSIEEKLDEWAEDYDNRSPTRQLLLSAAAEIRRLKSEQEKVDAADRATRALLERQVEEAVFERDAARKDSDVLRKMHNDLWKKYIDVIRCNAEIGTALVEKMTEK